MSSKFIGKHSAVRDDLCHHPGTPDHRQYQPERGHLLDLQHMPESKLQLDLLHTTSQKPEYRDRRSGEAGRLSIYITFYP